VENCARCESVSLPWATHAAYRPISRLPIHFGWALLAVAVIFALQTPSLAFTLLGPSSSLSFSIATA
jgi:hypothetical protein